LSLPARSEALTLQATGILDVLQLHGFDLSTRFKLVRHREAAYDMDYLLSRRWLDAYQAFQARPVFDNVDFIVAFIGVGSTQARLTGIYEILGRKAGREGKLPNDCPISSGGTYPTSTRCGASRDSEHWRTW
jgi:hypothetical protein